MRLGFALPQVGQNAGKDALVKVARRAEELGFDSLWVLDRLLYPVQPRLPYPLGDGSLPEQYKQVLDPLETLTFVAAITSQIALGTSVLNLPWYNPVLLSRRLITLDVLSAGRLRVGIGLGWSPDEYEAAGAPMSERGKRADELVRALKTIWTTDPVEFHGEYYSIPKSFIGPKAVQKPHPPIYMAAFTPQAMRRVAREADGWFPVGMPIGEIGKMFQDLKRMAQEYGRPAESIRLIVRGNLEFHERAIDGQRPEFVGTLEQIAGDVAAAKQAGASEIVFDVQFAARVTTIGQVLSSMADLRRLAT